MNEWLKMIDFSALSDMRAEVRLIVRYRGESD
jgi:hypothetical protein